MILDKQKWFTRLQVYNRFVTGLNKLKSFKFKKGLQVYRFTYRELNKIINIEYIHARIEIIYNLLRKLGCKPVNIFPNHFKYQKFNWYTGTKFIL